MAQRVKTFIIDDLTGEQLEEGHGETLKFSFDGRSYKIDLTKDNAQAFRDAVKPYIDAAQPATGTAPRAARSTTGSKRDKGYLQSVRNWAATRGIEINARGRIKQDIIDQYEADHAA